jgi:hypothetical protein
MDVEPANYSEDYIHDFQFETDSGKNLVLTGYNVKPFSKGGLSSPACCAALPGVGQTIRVRWRTGGDYYTPESDWTTHAAMTRIKGTSSDDAESNTSLILRFFPDGQIEAEYITQSLKFNSPLNPRVDLLFTGQRVMRHIGE